MNGARQKYASEALLCSAFIQWAEPQGWKTYPETCGWDMLMVRTADGAQLGVQAKLQANVKVIAQALADAGRYGRVGPDYRAVLVPETGGTSDYRTLCRRVGVALIEAWMPTAAQIKYKVKNPPFSPKLPVPFLASKQDHRDWQEHAPEERYPLPEYVPDVLPGIAGPLSLTPWKIKSIKAQIVLEKRGRIRRFEFRHLELSPSMWTQAWLIWTPDGYVPRLGKMPDFRAQHPVNFAQIEADWENWKPPEEPPPKAAAKKI